MPADINSRRHTHAAIENYLVPALHPFTVDAR